MSGMARYPERPPTTEEMLRHYLEIERARWRATREWLEAQRAEADAACDRLSTAAAVAFGDVLAWMDMLEREEGGR